ncbi:FAD-dependent pyridine nucleotide-disulfide oxidoreductase [Echria macrotheca]|uniref:FAD-dependent pyridine nucleotide-disulfide oxidoreductase n=1 Tax=Echria macrotheca TaxID=438768 RepID=A0AAJ0F6Q2_9PEZI|nr:FAD-dependent pyridine nucleotide-disulfide oxidoreductase [Echria macrotheca]
MPSRTQKRIVIVGGVAGGMSAATRLRRLDEKALITVFEKGPYPSFANCGIPYALSDAIPDRNSLLLQTPEGFKKRFNVDVLVNHEVTSIDRAAHAVTVLGPNNETKTVTYDKLILAQGAAPLTPPIPGVDLPHVFHLTTIGDLDAAKAYIAGHKAKTAAVIGGGFIGLEAAENLKLAGLDVTLVELAPHVLPPLDADMAEPVHAELRRNGISLALGDGVASISPDAVTTASGRVVPADVVLLVLGVRPRTELARAAGLPIGKAGGVVVDVHMRTDDPDIYAVGDMVETEHRVLGLPRVTALAGPANRQGRMAADHICGRAVGYRGNVGSAVVKVFEMTVGVVGLSVRELRRMGLDPLWVSAHPPDHAGYYPGAHPVSLKVAFRRGDGRLLGAQVIGAAGVDKRVDVLATAMQAHMSIFDLEHLELAYAPPYGSAKDPVNMAGFIGGNVLRGDVRVVHADEMTAEDLEGMQVVDVRGPGELAKGFLKGAVNIPINTLRENLDRLDKEKKTLVYCQVGYRGYLAYRILEQSGFKDVVNLDGGFKTVAQSGLTTLQASK